MLSGISKFFRELDRRIKILYIFMGVHLWNQQSSKQYDTLYATALGATPVELGTLNSVSKVTTSITTFFSGWIADRYGAKTTLLIGLATLTAVAAIYSFAGNWSILIPAILLYGAGSALIMPFVDMLFINYGKPENKSKIISISRTLWMIPRAVSPMVAAALVTSLGDISAGASSIRPLYYIQIVLAMVVFISIALWLKTPKGNSAEKTTEPAEKGRGFIQDFRDVFKGGIALKRYLAFSLVGNIGMNVVTAFVPLWMVNVKGADAYTLGLMTAAGMVTAMFLQIPVGRLSDKIGRKKTYFLLRPFTYLASLLLILAPGPEYLILVGVLGGNVFGMGVEGAGIGGISFIPSITMQWEMVSAEKRGRWHGILGLFGILTFPASILGGIMWQQGLMIPVLLLPVILEVFISIPILITIPETLGRTSLQ